jgi:hypothetical protein
MKRVLRMSRASSEWPTSSKDSVASLPGKGIPYDVNTRMLGGMEGGFAKVRLLNKGY